MTIARGLRGGLLPALVVLFLAMSLPAQGMGLRLNGSIGAKMYGLEDAAGEQHTYLMQSLRFSLRQTDGPFSLHMSGGFYGDSQSTEDDAYRARFLKGYLQYGGLMNRANVRLGRFFMARGVAIGVMDGLDASYALSRHIQVSVFGGMMGPLNREFEFNSPESDMAVGGMVRIKPAKCMMPFAKSGQMALSYVQQNRDDLVLRHRVGLQTRHVFVNGFRWFNTLQLRPEGNLFRKFVSRLHMHTGRWFGSLEAGAFSPDIHADSWFAETPEVVPAQGRFRANVNHWLVMHEWGLGMEATSLHSQGSYGLRYGPRVITPAGEFGYRLAEGDHAKSRGPWVNLRYRPQKGVYLYAFGALTTHKWEAMDLEEEDLVMVHAGTRVDLPQVPGLTVFGEYQMYESPQYRQDHRLMGGLTLRFDTGRE